MALRIEDYALIGDTQSAALVGRDGSLDWLCLPRFDSAACFSALLGDARNGRWLVAPAHPHGPARRAYRDNTLVLDTEWDADGGRVRVTDFMPVRGYRAGGVERFAREEADVVRVVEGLSGRVAVRVELTVRFDYGSIVPWVRRIGDGCLSFVAGPDAVVLRTDVELRPDDLRHVGEFIIEAGQRVGFVLTWYPSHEPAPSSVDPDQAVAETTEWWSDWAAKSCYDGPWRPAVGRSLATLKALTYGPSGGIVAAATTSLPEQIGGVRNWDYRFCWLRDAALTLESLLAAGYTEEAVAWREWLLRAVAGVPSDLQIMYGCTGERRLTELELPWLAGYEGSAPVRVGNAAAEQFQLDVYGEVIATLHLGRSQGISDDPTSWSLQCRMLDFLEGRWRDPDMGIWEVRGGPRDFTHSKVMAWVAFDRAVRTVEGEDFDGPLDRWKAARQAIHDEVCAKGYDAELGSFTQAYGGSEVDASLLMMAIVGFLPASDPRIVGTVRAVQERLVDRGFVHRYQCDPAVDGLPEGEGAFLACTAWLADNLALQGRVDEAVEVFRRVLGVANDVGLLAEEYDAQAGRLVGNFPQAFSHVSVITSAIRLGQAGYREPPGRGGEGDPRSNGG